MNEKKALIKWLNGYEWNIFGTLNFKYQMNETAAENTLKYFWNRVDRYYFGNKSHRNNINFFYTLKKILMIKHYFVKYKKNKFFNIIKPSLMTFTFFFPAILFLSKLGTDFSCIWLLCALMGNSTQ